MTCKTNVGRKHRFLFYVPLEASQDVVGGLATATTTRRIAPISMDHRWTPEYTEDDGNNGTPWRPKEGVTYNRGMGQGGISLRPRPDDLRDILPFVVRGAWATDVIEPAENFCSTFGFLHHASIRAHQFYMAETNTFTFASSASDPQLRLEINPESSLFSSLAVSPTDPFPDDISISALQPFVHSKSTLKIGSDYFPFDNFQFTGNYNLNTDLFYNSTTRHDLVSGDHLFQVTHTSPFDDATQAALLDLGETSVAMEVIYTNGLYSVKFDFPALHSPVATPVMGSGNTPVTHNGIQWTARSKAGASPGDPVVKPFKITLDDNGAA